MDAWTYLLKQPLKEAEAPVAGHQKDVLLDFFKLLFEWVPLQCYYPSYILQTHILEVTLCVSLYSLSHELGI